MQVVLQSKGVLSRLSRLLELQRMALWLRTPGSEAAHVNATINAITNMAINPDHTQELEVR